MPRLPRCSTYCAVLRLTADAKNHAADAERFLLIGTCRQAGCAGIRLSAANAQRLPSKPPRRKIGVLETYQGPGQPALTKRAGWDQLKTGYDQALIRSTGKEMQELIRFYESPVGKAVGENAPTPDRAICAVDPSSWKVQCLRSTNCSLK
jgi:hypothetical protein